ncbi:MAG: ATP-binding protein [Thermodesulfobacteriota bacterium]
MTGPLLIVDDEPAVLKVMRQILSPEYALLLVDNGAAALEAASKHNPSLILLDIKMPGMDGYTVCRRLKADPQTEHIPVIFVTGLAAPEEEAAGFAAGAVDYLAKPLSAAIVKARVRLHLSLVSTKHLAESEAYARALFEDSQNAMGVMDPATGRFIEINEAARMLFGLPSRETIRGLTPWDVSSPLQANGVASTTLAHKYIEAALARGAQWFEWRHRRPNGEEWDAEVHLMSFQRKGRSLLQFSIQDVTKRKQAELEKKKMESFVYQQEKLASIGQLAAGVAHEINNPMGFITSNLSSLGKYAQKISEYLRKQSELTASLPVDTELKALRNRLKIDHILGDLDSLVQESLEGAARVSEIVKNLKSFSRAAESKCTEADLNECLENTIKVIWNELKYKTTIHKEYGQLELAKCYPQQLNQVFMNLLVNAAQAIENRGEITIKTWQQGDNLFVAISDTGMGIPADNLHLVFDPFFTTKEAGKGTGLGLSIAHQIIEKHKGEIAVESEVGKGTTFTIRLPIRHDEIEA